MSKVKDLLIIPRGLLLNTSTKYKNFSNIEKILVGVGLLVVITAFAWRLEVDNLAYVSGISAAILLAIHLALTFLPWTPIIVMSLFTSLLFPLIALYYTMFDPYSFDVTFASLVVSGILGGILAYRYSRGRLWLTLLLSQLALLLAGPALSLIIQSYFSFFAGLAVSFLVIFLRSSKLLQRKSKKTPLTKTLDYKQRQKTINETSISACEILTPPQEVKEYDAVIVNRKNNAALVSVVEFQQHLSIKRNTLISDGKYLDDLLAEKLITSNAFGAKYHVAIPRTIILSKDRALRKRSFYIRIQSREGLELGTVMISHPLNSERDIQPFLLKGSNLTKEEKIKLISIFTKEDSQETYESNSDKNSL